MRNRATRLTALGSSARRPIINVFEGAVGAYAMRIPAKSTYSGPLIRARRALDDAEQDFGAEAIADSFGNRWMDFGALGIWSEGDAFITTIYDQSGNGRDMVQTDPATQPIIHSGSVGTTNINGRPAPQYQDGRFMQATGAVFWNQLQGSAFSVFRRDDNGTSARSVWWNRIPGTAGRLLRTTLPAAASSHVGGGAVSLLTTTPITPYAHYYYQTSNMLGSKANTLAEVAAASTLYNPTNITPRISEGGGSENFMGPIGEVVFFDTPHDAATRAIINRSQANAYGITVS